MIFKAMTDWSADKLNPILAMYFETQNFQLIYKYTWYFLFAHLYDLAWKEIMDSNTKKNWGNV